MSEAAGGVAALRREDVIRVLDGCYDPCCEERRISVVDMGLIEDVEICGGRVGIRMLLTSGWCPFAARLTETIRERVGGLPGVEAVEVEVVWDPVWSPERMSESAREKLRLPLERLLPLREARIGRGGRR
ncbi:metal-sulfur cluster assembly factor [Rubrobacter xylanophilus]|uniref:metal-sulfur cluster assembly factor n=1 Tax=Rubrobacter xylanophilus TaxID=49319 RepID=UPI00117AA437|nr:iron-sulfur cluster assembly protein [Rubrobacter xylanophilus]